jgi:hypothetical protein
MAKKRKKEKDVDINIKVDNLDKAIKEGKKWHDKSKKDKLKCRSTCGGFGYFLGFIGAVIYYISTADSFWIGVLGVLKAIVWPAFLIFELLKFLGA